MAITIAGVDVELPADVRETGASHSRGVSYSNRTTRTVLIPTNPEEWAQRMKEMIHRERKLPMIFKGGDLPGHILVSFGEDSNEKEGFGFYADAEALQSIIAVATLCLSQLNMTKDS